MSSPPALPPGWTPERPSPLPVTPSTNKFRRPDPPSAHSHLPTTPSPLSPFSTTPPASTTVHSIFSIAPAPKTPRQPLSAYPLSHYYRAPRSTLSSPCRSNYSSPSVSPTRSNRRTRIQALLATDPLLSRLTPAAIREMANDYEVGFTPEERAWSLRAAEGIVRVGEWLREVEGWGIAWGRGKGGVGYLPPEPGKRRKRRLTAKEDGMKTIEEEVKTLEEPTTNNRAGRPMTPMQLRMQRKAAAENDPSTPVRTKTLSHPNDTESEEDYEDIDESEEYLGSLPKSTVLRYEARIEDITDQVEELDVEGLKGKVLSYRTGIENPLTSSSAIITATTLQLLPPLHRLMKLLSTWAIRLAVLKIVPVFLRWLDNAKHALDAGYEAIRLPAIVNGTQRLDEEIFDVMAENIQQRVTAAGRIMDSMLDALEGREDVIPDTWIGDLEAIEEGVGNWEMDAERVVLEGRLREVSKAEEFRTEKEKMHLVMESERVADEARQDENAVEDVLEKVGELERGLMEALETQEDVEECIEIEGQTEETLEEQETVSLGLDKSLLKRLRDVQSAEVEVDRGRRWRRSDSIGELSLSVSPGKDMTSPISSPDQFMEWRKNEAESMADDERRILFEKAFRERLKPVSKARGEPATIVVEGFEVPVEPKTAFQKELLERNDYEGFESDTDEDLENDNENLENDEEDLENDEEDLENDEEDLENDEEDLENDNELMPIVKLVTISISPPSPHTPRNRSPRPQNFALDLSPLPKGTEFSTPPLSLEEELSLAAVLSEDPELPSTPESCEGEETEKAPARDTDSEWEDIMVERKARRVVSPKRVRRVSEGVEEAERVLPVGRTAEAGSVIEIGSTLEVESVPKPGIVASIPYSEPEVNAAIPSEPVEPAIANPEVKVKIPLVPGVKDKLPLEPSASDIFPETIKEAELPTKEAELPAKKADHLEIVQHAEIASDAPSSFSGSLLSSIAAAALVPVVAVVSKAMARDEGSEEDGGPVVTREVLAGPVLLDEKEKGPVRAPEALSAPAVTEEENESVHTPDAISAPTVTKEDTEPILPTEVLSEPTVVEEEKFPAITPKVLTEPSATEDVTITVAVEEDIPDVAKEVSVEESAAEISVPIKRDEFVEEADASPIEFQSEAPVALPESSVVEYSPTTEVVEELPSSDMIVSEISEEPVSTVSEESISTAPVVDFSAVLEVVVPETVEQEVVVEADEKLLDELPTPDFVHDHSNVIEMVIPEVADETLSTVTEEPEAVLGALFVENPEVYSTVPVVEEAIIVAPEEPAIGSPASSPVVSALEDHTEEALAPIAPKPLLILEAQSSDVEVDVVVPEAVGSVRPRIMISEEVSEQLETVKFPKAAVVSEEPVISPVEASVPEELPFPTVEEAIADSEEQLITTALGDDLSSPATIEEEASTASEGQIISRAASEFLFSEVVNTATSEVIEEDVSSTFQELDVSSDAPELPSSLVADKSVPKEIQDSVPTVSEPVIKEDFLDNIGKTPVLEEDVSSVAAIPAAAFVDVAGALVATDAISSEEKETVIPEEKVVEEAVLEKAPKPLKPVEEQSAETDAIFVDKNSLAQHAENEVPEQDGGPLTIASEIPAVSSQPEVAETIAPEFAAVSQTEEAASSINEEAVVPAMVEHAKQESLETESEANTVAVPLEINYTADIENSSQETNTSSSVDHIAELVDDVIEEKSIEAETHTEVALDNGTTTSISMLDISARFDEIFGDESPDAEVMFQYEQEAVADAISRSVVQEETLFAPGFAPLFPPAVDTMAVEPEPEAPLFLLESVVEEPEPVDVEDQQMDAVRITLPLSPTEEKGTVDSFEALFTATVEKEVPAEVSEEVLEVEKLNREEPLDQVREEDSLVPVREEEAVVPVQEEMAVVPVQEEMAVVPVQEEMAVVPVQEEMTVVLVQEEEVLVSEEESVVPVQEEMTVVPVQEEEVLVSEEESVVPVPSEILAVERPTEVSDSPLWTVPEPTFEEPTVLVSSPEESDKPAPRAKDPENSIEKENVPPARVRVSMAKRMFESNTQGESLVVTPRRRAFVEYPSSSPRGDSSLPVIDEAHPTNFEGDESYQLPSSPRSAYLPSVALEYTGIEPDESCAIGSTSPVRELDIGRHNITLGFSEDEDELDMSAISDQMLPAHMTSSPPKFDVEDSFGDSPRLPTTRRAFNSSPSSLYQGQDSFFDASDVGDESITFDDTFEIPQPPLPPVMPTHLGRRPGLATDLPSISEANTPQSMREEYFGSLNVPSNNVKSLRKRLEEAPMLPDNIVSSRSLDEENEDSTARKVKVSGKTVRKTSRSFFTAEPQLSEEEDEDGYDEPSSVVFDETIPLELKNSIEQWQESPISPTFDLDTSPSSSPSRNATTGEFEDSPQLIRMPKRNVLIPEPSESISRSPTPDKSRPWLEGAAINPQGAQATAIPPRSADRELDLRINELLMSLPRKVKLTASNLQRLNEQSTKKTPIGSRPWDAIPKSNIPAPKSATTTSERSSLRSTRRHQSSIQGDIKCYHLHRNDDQPPMKLYVRLVGNARLVCRVGGGWSDLEEYLKEWATHHGSKMRAVSETRLEIREMPYSSAATNQRTIRPSTSNSSLGAARFMSPTPLLRSPTPLLRSPTPSYSSRPDSPAAIIADASSPSFSVTVAPRRLSRTASPQGRRPNSPMLLSHRGLESPNSGLLTPSGAPSLGPSPVLRGGHNGTGRSLPVTPIIGSSPGTPTSPHSPSDPSPSRGLRRQTSRLSITEMAGAEDLATPLGLAGPRSKLKTITAENQAWIEGMIGQVRKASTEHYRYGSVGNYTDADFDEEADEGAEPRVGGRRRSGSIREWDSPEDGRSGRSRSNSALGAGRRQVSESRLQKPVARALPLPTPPSALATPSDSRLQMPRARAESAIKSEQKMQLPRAKPGSAMGTPVEPRARPGSAMGGGRPGSAMGGGRPGSAMGGRPSSAMGGGKPGSAMGGPSAIGRPPSSVGSSRVPQAGNTRTLPTGGSTKAPPGGAAKSLLAPPAAVGIVKPTSSLSGSSSAPRPQSALGGAGASSIARPTSSLGAARGRPSSAMGGGRPGSAMGGEEQGGEKKVFLKRGDGATRGRGDGAARGRGDGTTRGRGKRGGGFSGGDVPAMGGRGA